MIQISYFCLYLKLVWLPSAWIYFLSCWLLTFYSPISIRPFHPFPSSFLIKIPLSLSLLLWRSCLKKLFLFLFSLVSLLTKVLHQEGHRFSERLLNAGRSPPSFAEVVFVSLINQRQSQPPAVWLNYLFLPVRKREVGEAKKEMFSFF